MPYPVIDDPDRVAVVQQLGGLLSLGDANLQAVITLTSQLLAAHQVYLSLIDADQQWVVAAATTQDSEHISIGDSICVHTLTTQPLLACSDLPNNPKLADTQWVRAGAKAYLGHCLYDDAGRPLGVLAVVQQQPQHFSDLQRQQLQQLALLAETHWQQLLHKQLDRHLDQTRQLLDVRERSIRDWFGPYLPDEIVQGAFAQTPGDATTPTLGGQRRTVTLLMSDLRDFTPLSERHPPETVVKVLNRYLDAMVDVILEYDGFIDEFIGDAILVVFGLREDGQADHARRAVACAIAMQKAMSKVNDAACKEAEPELAMGVAIHTGEVIVGNIGSAKRIKFGVVGSPVNLTARIQDYCLGGQVLISHSSRLLAGDDLRIDGQLRVKAKGVRQPIAIYDIGAMGTDPKLCLPAPDRFSI